MQRGSDTPAEGGGPDPAASRPVPSGSAATLADLAREMGPTWAPQRRARPTRWRRRRRLLIALVAVAGATSATMWLSGPRREDDAADAPQPTSNASASDAVSPTPVTTVATSPASTTDSSTSATPTTSTTSPTSTSTTTTSTTSASTTTILTTSSSVRPTSSVVPPATSPTVPPVTSRPPSSQPPITAAPPPTTPPITASTKSFTFAVTATHCFEPCSISVHAPAASHVTLFAPGGVQVGSGTTVTAGTGSYGTWRVEVTATTGGFGWTWTT